MMDDDHHHHGFKPLVGFVLTVSIDYAISHHLKQTNGGKWGRGSDYCPNYFDLRIQCNEAMPWWQCQRSVVWLQLDKF